MAVAPAKAGASIGLAHCCQRPPPLRGRRAIAKGHHPRYTAFAGGSGDRRRWGIPTGEESPGSTETTVPDNVRRIGLWAGLGKVPQRRDRPRLRPGER